MDINNADENDNAVGFTVCGSVGSLLVTKLDSTDHNAWI